MDEKNRPINKEYLISSLKDFDEKILSKKYNNANEKAGKSAYQIAVDNGFKGNEEEWLNSLIGKEGVPGKNGRSIYSISIDNNNNVFVIFSDGTEQNVGKLSADISADFLTEGGFGKIRYYNGRFQYHNNITDIWVDIAATSNNMLVVNMMPKPMQKIFGIYDHKIGHYKLKWIEPEDTIVDGQMICIVDKVVIKRKLGSVPENENDGELVIDIKRIDFGQYQKEWFIDETISPTIGEVYYYKAFPMSTTGFYNSSVLNETGGIESKDYYLYGFKIDQNESDPDSMITYLKDNQNFSSVYMNYETDTFIYGDWKDIFFMQVKPCMLKYDGCVDYYLNPNDYTLKEDGTSSDITNDSYGGNAMVQFPKVYWKIVNNDDNTANIYISDKKLDDNFACWSHVDNNGNEIDYCYMPIYNGSNSNGVLRSLSDKEPIRFLTADTEISYAKANNLTDNIIWYTEVYSDRVLINLILLLIGKSTDTKKIFGYGNNSSYVSTSDDGIKVTGTLNKKGLFYGSTDNKTGVKVFGIEHYWGNQGRRTAGYISDKGKQKVKLTYNQSDGSEVIGYNIDGNGYISIPNSTLSGTNGGYISKMLFTKQGIVPIVASGSVTTYYTNGLWFDNLVTAYSVFGGNSNHNLRVGALSTALYRDISVAGWSIGASLSCKPLAKRGGSA